MHAFLQNRVQAGKRRTLEQETLDTVSVAGPPTKKRKEHTARGATPPTRRPRTFETDEATENGKNNRSAENWAELYEFDEWLQSPEAMHTREDLIDKDRQLVKDVLLHPPSRFTLQSAGPQLREQRNRQTVVLWHGRCVQPDLQNYRIWRPGRIVNMLRKSPKQALPHALGAVTD